MTWGMLDSRRHAVGLAESFKIAGETGADMNQFRLTIVLNGREKTGFAEKPH